MSHVPCSDNYKQSGISLKVTDFFQKKKEKKGKKNQPNQPPFKYSFSAADASTPRKI